MTTLIHTTPVIKYHILVLEANANIHTQMVEHFTQRQYTISTMQNSDNVLQMSTLTQCDCILLGMPSTIDNILILQQLRQCSNVPVIMISPRHDQHEKILAMQMGADDYLSKPMDLRELDVRIIAILRRIHTTSSTNNTPYLQFNFNNRSVLMNGNVIEFTPMEFAIISALLQSPNRVFSRQELITLIFSEQFSQVSISRAIDMHISNIRTKIEQNPDKPQYIVTVYAKGYMYQTR